MSLRALQRGAPVHGKPLRFHYKADVHNVSVLCVSFNAAVYRTSKYSLTISLNQLCEAQLPLAPMADLGKLRINGNKA